MPNPGAIEPVTSAPTLVSDELTIVEPKVVPDRIVLLPIEYDWPDATVTDPLIEIEENPLVIEPELSAPTLVSEELIIELPNVVLDRTEILFIS